MSLSTDAPPWLKPRRFVSPLPPDAVGRIAARFDRGEDDFTVATKERLPYSAVRDLFHYWSCEDG